MAVESPDFDAFYRQVCRWFSEKFCTKLVEVEGYAEEYVLQHYFEDLLHILKTSSNQDSKTHYDELLAEITHVAEDDIAEAVEEDEDDLWEQQMLDEIKKDEEKRLSKAGPTKPPQPPVNPNLIEDPEDIHIEGESETSLDDEGESE
ncbi:MAG: hypothetical protein ACREGB_02820 [Candidatus Saccharimonadales bacterium]